MSETTRLQEAQGQEQPDGHARRIVGLEELEHRVRELEARLRAHEDERDELIRACCEARTAQAAAEEALRVREDMLGVVAHDLRNPLGTIVMGAATLRQLGASEPRAQRICETADRIHRQAEHMARQIADLADLVALQAGRLEIHRERCAPRAIVTAAGALVGSIARERGVAFEAGASPDLPDIECDCERAVQVLANLVTSAVKVTVRGGAIEIGARAADNHGVVFFVRDSGPGIARDDLPALFGPVWQRKQPSERGAGLGFALARGVVDAHGGQIWAESEPGIGSTVYFSLTPPSN